MVLTDFQAYLTDFDGGPRPPPRFDVLPPPVWHAPCPSRVLLRSCHGAKIIYE